MRLVIDIARLIKSLLKFCLVMMMLQNCVKIRANIKKIEHSFKNYRIICEEWNVSSNGEAAFRNYLSTLEAIGILGKVTKGVKGRKGVRARLTIHDVPAAILIERIEVFLSKRFRTNDNF